MSNVSGAWWITLDVICSMNVAKMRETAEHLSDEDLDRAFEDVQRYLEEDMAFPRQLWRRGFTASFDEQAISVKYAPRGKMMLWRAALMRAADLPER